ncbi:MAG TPA: LacI family DNA-binding transcriptional regulator [Terriglobales bacterium]|nr:LacI family DNA-binding transcriptional regulator [Terriglobales bacterium]
MKEARTRNTRRTTDVFRRGKSVSLRSLAEYLKLSPATISVVINDSPAARAIPTHTQDRIRNAARKLNYRPNFFARSLSLKRGFMIGVLVPEVSEGYAASIMGGIEDRLLREGYFYFVASHRGQADLIEEYPRLLADRAAEGVILINTPVMQELSVPIVTISGHRRVQGVTNITVDNKKAAFLALEHLAKLGHEQIAFFKGHLGSADTEQRWKGILRAAQLFGIKVQPELTVQLQWDAAHPGPSLPEEGYVNARKLLATGRPFTALFAFNDVSAIGAMRAFGEAGLRVPEDISVIGFDDIHVAAYLTPRLTTLRQPLTQMGELAAQQLLQRISSDNGSRLHSISLQPELVVRESTGPVPGYPRSRLLEARKSPLLV